MLYQSKDEHHQFLYRLVLSNQLFRVAQEFLFLDRQDQSSLDDDKQIFDQYPLVNSAFLQLDRLFSDLITSRHHQVLLLDLLLFRLHQLFSNHQGSYHILMEDIDKLILLNGLFLLVSSHHHRLLSMCLQRLHPAQVLLSLVQTKHQNSSLQWLLVYQVQSGFLHNAYLT